MWCLAIGYGLQVFFDFAGYSHLAIGAARMMGFVLPENFNRPFASVTPSIFWTRWHMSLSFWIRDYVFMPLAMLGRREWWRKFCLLIAMVLFGVWHKGTILFVLFRCCRECCSISPPAGATGGAAIQLGRPSGRAWTFFSWLLTMVLITWDGSSSRANSLTR